MSRPAPRTPAATLLLALPLLAGCRQEPVDLLLPAAAQVESRYEYEGALEAEIVGNVAVLTVAQDAEQLRRGGSLWAKVGPYVFLFTEETQTLFEDFNGLGGVRVSTVVGNARVATALLARDELSDVQWRRSLNISGLARRDGTERVALLEDLIRWGEGHTEHEYNPRYTHGR
jgi:hypothetical protein